MTEGVDGRVLAALLGVAAVGLAGAASQASAPSQVVQTEVSDPTGALGGVCHLTVRRMWLGVFPRTFNSSGARVGDGFVVTAAHNLYNPAYYPVRDIQVACGVAAPADIDHVGVPLDRVRIASRYRFRSFPRDYAVLALPDASASTPHFILGDAPAYAGPVRVAGFPGSPDETDRMDGRRLFEARADGRLDPDGRFLRYEVLTFTGNSGGPAWRETNEGPVLLGIHVAPGTARALDAAALAELETMMTDLSRALPTPSVEGSAQ